MARCLSDDELQTIVDDEASGADRRHAAECPACADRLDARRRLTARVLDAAGRDGLPPAVRESLRTQLSNTEAPGAPATGATTLRPVRSAPRWLWPAGLAAAAGLLLFFVVVPGVDRQTTVSAAEILGRSRTALAAPVSGVEVLTYDLGVDGVLGDLIPDEQAGRFTVQEVIDHDHDGRYRIVKLAANGEMVGGAADDPLRHTRVRYVRASGRGYLLRFDGADLTVLSLPALKRMVLQTFIGLMQASSGQTLREMQRAGETCYEIDIPQSVVEPGSLLALARARAVVTAADSRLVEFSAAGAVADRPFTVDFVLRSRQMRPAAAAGEGRLRHHRATRRRRPPGRCVRQPDVGCRGARARRNPGVAGESVTDAIRAESLTKYYGAVVGVEDLDLVVSPGEVYGFLGPNGAGKTTTIRILLDLVRPTRGRAFVDGLDCRAASVAVRSRIGYLPAEMPLYREMTGSGYLAFLGALQRTPVDPAWLRRLLARFDVGDVDLRRRLGDLSHGMKRKFGIIQALMGHPPLLILDEPTSGLDPLMIEAFAETVHELKTGGATTIFLSSHVLSEVERLCDRVGIIRRGRLVRQTSIADLRRDTPRRVRVFFDGPAPEPPPALLAAITRRDDRRWELAWHGPLGDALESMRGLAIADLEIEPFKLEDYVLKIYADGGPQA